MFITKKSITLIFSLSILMPFNIYANQNMSTNDISMSLKGYIQVFTGEKFSYGRKSNQLKSRYYKGERSRFAKYLKKDLEKYGIRSRLNKFEMKIHHKSKVKNVKGINVIGKIKATKKTDEVILIGAHYDTVKGTPGANDNGSGIATVLLLAKELKNLKCRDKDIIVAFFDKEEHNREGSKIFVMNLMNQNNKKFLEAHIFDQMGWISKESDHTVELIDAADEMLNLYKNVNDKKNHQFNITQSSSIYGDHFSFTRFGFGSYSVSEPFYNLAEDDRYPHYHKKEDSAEKLNYPYLTGVFKLTRDVLIERVSESCSN